MRRLPLQIGDQMASLNLKNEKKRLKKWLDRKEGSYDSPVRKIEGRLSTSLDAGISVWLDCLASWHGNLGNLEVLEGKKTGWIELKKSYDFRSLSIRIIAAYQDSGKYGYLSTGDLALCLSMAIAFRLDAFASWLGERLMNSLQAKDGKYKLGPSAALNYAFIQFYALSRRKNFNVKDYTKESLGVYQAILDAWQDEKQYLKACMQACDYHVERMDEQEGFSEFLGAPEDLLPVEILMIRRIRKDHGLPNPEINHPLMQTPLANAPETLPDIKDELQQKVVAKARKELEHFPEF